MSEVRSDPTREATGVGFSRCFLVPKPGHLSVAFLGTGMERPQPKSRHGISNLSPNNP